MKWRKFGRKRLAKFVASLRWLDDQPSEITYCKLDCGAYLFVFKCDRAPIYQFGVVQGTLSDANIAYSKRTSIIMSKSNLKSIVDAIESFANLL